MRLGDIKSNKGFSAVELLLVVVLLLVAILGWWYLTNSSQSNSGTRLEIVPSPAAQLPTSITTLSPTPSTVVPESRENGFFYGKVLYITNDDIWQVEPST